MNKQIKLLSVVITCVENDKKHLKNCLLSLEKSAEAAKIKLEIIIICNGTDISYPIYLKSPVRIIKNEKNIGFGRAINRGMKIAKGKWCIIPTPDIITHIDTIQKMLRYTIKPQVAIITPKIYLTDNKLDYYLMPLPSLWNIFLEQSYLYKLSIPRFKLPNSDINQYNYTHEIKAAACAYWMIRKKYFFNVGGFDPKFFLYYEDIDLCKRMSDKGYKIFYTPDTSNTHIGHQSTKGITRGDFYFNGFTKYMSKYYSKIQTFIACFFYLFGSLLRIIFLEIQRILTTNDQKKEFCKNKKTYCIQVMKSTLIYLIKNIRLNHAL